MGVFSRKFSKNSPSSLILKIARPFVGAFPKKEICRKKGFSAQISKLSGETFHC